MVESVNAPQPTSGPSAGRLAGGEWLTLALIGVTVACWMLLTYFWTQIPWYLLAPAAGYCLALYGSLQHEAIHGHPTSSRRINLALVWMPLSLWMPLSVYESTHKAHHLNELTTPGVDPESWYVPSAAWRRLSGPARWLLRVNNTFAGRMIVGPWIATWQCWSTLIAELVRHGRHAGTIAAHAVGVAAVMYWVIEVCAMPAWFYVLVFMWPGMSLSLVRSFAEHRYHPSPERRTAVVRGGVLTRLMFLNNNFHVVHHRHPSLPWYRIPAAYRREAAVGEDDFVFAGYGDIVRRYLLTPWTSPEFPGDVSR